VPGERATAHPPLLVPPKNLRLGLGSAVHMGRLVGPVGLLRASVACWDLLHSATAPARLPRERLGSEWRAHRDLLLEGRASEVAMGWKIVDGGLGVWHE